METVQGIAQGIGFGGQRSMRWNVTPDTPTVTINSNTSLTVNNVITGLGKSVTAVEYWGSTDNVTFTKLIKAGATTSYDHDGLENNSIHYYKVRYWAGLYVSGFSGVVMAYVLDTLQRLLGDVKSSDGITLFDISGNNNDAVLVNSNCINVPITAGINSISDDPINDGFSCYDFSCEFSFSTQQPAGPRHIFGRVNGAVFNNFLSVFMVYQNELRYYSASGSANSYVLICPVSTDTIYKVKASVNNTAGIISWEVNGTPGNNSFTNRTPATLQTADQFLIGRGNTTYYSIYGKLADLKYYSGLNYTILTDHWPLSEGYGTTGYNIERAKHLILTNAGYWGTQDIFHWNYIKGFQLYGNSDASNHLIRVPYKNDGSVLSPVISGFTKFSECPSGVFHNFAETGIKRNPLGDAAINAVGIDSDNIIYYGGADGTDNYSFCLNYLDNENNYIIADTPGDKKSLMQYPSFADYLRNGKQKRIIGTTGKIHNTSIKYCCESGEFDSILRNGIYALTTAAEMNILFYEGGGLIGESRSDAVVNAKLDASTAKATIEATSLFLSYNSPSHLIANGIFTAQNMRYTVHGDNTGTTDKTKTYKNASFIHYGNHEAYLIDPTVFNTCDAFGGGYNSNVILEATDCYFEGHEEDGGTGRGFALHNNGTEAEVSTALLTRCEFKSNGGDRCVRFNVGSTGQLDKITFIECEFNSQKIYIDPTSVYDALADKIQLYKNSSDIAPEIITSDPYHTTKAFIGLEFEADNNGETISVVDGTTTTLIMGSPISDTSGEKHHIRGDKNITDSVFITNHVHLGADMLQDCAITNKTMQIIVNSVTYTLTFDVDYTSMTNTEVISAINSILDGLYCPATCKEYDYLANAAFRNL